MTTVFLITRSHILSEWIRMMDAIVEFRPELYDRQVALRVLHHGRRRR